MHHNNSQAIRWLELVLPLFICLAYSVGMGVLLFAVPDIRLIIGFGLFFTFCLPQLFFVLAYWYEMRYGKGVLLFLLGSFGLSLLATSSASYVAIWLRIIYHHSCVCVCDPQASGLAFMGIALLSWMIVCVQLGELYWFRRWLWHSIPALQWWLEKNLIAVLLDEHRLWVYDQLHDRAYSCALSDLPESRHTDPYQLHAAVHHAKCQARHRRQQLLMLSGPFLMEDAAAAYSQDFLKSYRKLKDVVLILDYAMCLAIGADLQPTDIDKKICVFVHNDGVLIATLFTGGFYEKELLAHSEVQEHMVILTRQIEERFTAAAALPKNFGEKRFTEEELQAITTRWSQPPHEQVHIFPLIPVSYSLDLHSSLFRSTLHTDIQSCAECGIQEMVTSLADPNILDVIFSKAL